MTNNIIVYIIHIDDTNLSKGGATKMQITDVRLKRVNSENRMKAIASVTFDEEFVVHDIKVIESQNGLFIAMPSKTTPNGKFKDVAHPINKSTREKIQNAIFEKYNSPDVEEVSTVEAAEATEEE